MRTKGTAQWHPAKEFLVIRGYAKLYDPDAVRDPALDMEAWDAVRGHLADGTVDRLKKAAGSERVHMLFCNTCSRNDAEKCYVCGYDIACVNLFGSRGADGFERVRLESCEYAVFEYKSTCETALPSAHEETDDFFWGKWLKSNPYDSAIDNPANWQGNGFAAIEMYTPFDPDATTYHAIMLYPIIRKHK